MLKTKMIFLIPRKEHSEGNTFILNVGGDIPKSLISKRKNKKVGLCQTEKIYTAKEAINKMKKQIIDWEKIFKAICIYLLRN